MWKCACLGEREGLVVMVSSGQGQCATWLSTRAMGGTGGRGGFKHLGGGQRGGPWEGGGRGKKGVEKIEERTGTSGPQGFKFPVDAAPRR